MKVVPVQDPQQGQGGKECGDKCPGPDTGDGQQAAKGCAPGCGGQGFQHCRRGQDYPGDPEQ